MGADTAGLYVVSRTASNSQTLDFNGAQRDLTTIASTTVPNATLGVFNENGYLTTRQACAFGVGGGLSPTDRVNYYNRLRTYMTAVEYYVAEDGTTNYVTEDGITYYVPE